MSLDDIVRPIEDPEDRAAARAIILANTRRRFARMNAALAEGKRCPSCDEIKPLDSFGLNASRPDGRAAACRECEAERIRARRVRQ